MAGSSEVNRPVTVSEPPTNHCRPPSPQESPRRKQGGQLMGHHQVDIMEGHELKNTGSNGWVVQKFGGTSVGKFPDKVG